MNTLVTLFTPAHSYRIGWRQFCISKLRCGCLLCAIRSLAQLSSPVGFGFGRDALVDLKHQVTSDDSRHSPPRVRLGLVAVAQNSISPGAAYGHQQSFRSTTRRCSRVSSSTTSSHAKRFPRSACQIHRQYETRAVRKDRTCLSLARLRSAVKLPVGGRGLFGSNPVRRVGP